MGKNEIDHQKPKYSGIYKNIIFFFGDLFIFILCAWGFFFLQVCLNHISRVPGKIQKRDGGVPGPGVTDGD